MAVLPQRAILLYDDNGLPMAVQDGIAIPAGTSGVLVMGADSTGNARAVAVNDDGTLTMSSSGESTDTTNMESLLSRILSCLERVETHLAAMSDEHITDGKAQQNGED